MQGREYYDTMQVCMAGHLITAYYDSSPIDRADHCSSCGAPTLTKCEKCGAKIRGHHHIPGVVLAIGENPPSHCHQCGAAYPWTEEQGTSSAVVGNGIDLVRQICSRFDAVSSQLQTRRQSRPPLLIQDEYDVQYLLRALLAVHFADIRPEEYAPSYAGGTSRMDFLLRDSKLVIETKMTRDGLAEKEIGEELIVDIAKYKSHPDCKSLFCLVYDPKRIIKNPAGLESDLSGIHDGITVEVMVIPRGMLPPRLRGISGSAKPV